MTEALILFLYPLVGIISVSGFLPQIKNLIYARSVCHDISASTWCLWVFSGIITLAYGLVKLQDLMFCITVGGNLSMTMTITGLIFYKRWRFSERKTMKAAPIPVEVI